VLSEQEVKMIFNHVDNLKHKCILSLTYSAGLRLGEVINLKPTDIDSKRNYVIIRQGKGKKDRYSLLSVRILELLRQYYREYQPKEYLFEGQFGGPYSATSIHNILKAAVTKAGIKKRVTVHTLRHSFATHLMENGVDIRYIQTLLGHQSSRTTEIYTHITQRGLGKIKSPLDNLDI
jgi:integrase/recombinase XerD